jgi:hypothetical protein
MMDGADGSAVNSPPALAHQRAVAAAFPGPPDITERLITSLGHLTSGPPDVFVPTDVFVPAGSEDAPPPPRAERGYRFEVVDQP